MSEMIVRMTSGKVPAAMPSVATNQPMHTMQTMTMMRFNRLRPGSVRGLPEIRAESFKFAMIEPVKVTAPMNTAMPTSPIWKAPS